MEHNTRRKAKRTNPKIYSNSWKDNNANVHSYRGSSKKQVSWDYFKKKFHPNKLSFRHLSKLSCPNGSRTCNDSFRDARQEDYIRKVQELGPDHSSIQELGNKVKQQRRLRQQQSQGVTLCKKPNGDQGADSDVLCNTWLQLRTLYTQHWTGQGNFTRAAALSALMNQRQGRNELTVNTEDSKEIS